MPSRWKLSRDRLLVWSASFHRKIDDREPWHLCRRSLRHLRTEKAACLASLRQAGPALLVGLSGGQRTPARCAHLSQHGTLQSGQNSALGPLSTHLTSDVFS